MPIHKFTDSTAKPDEYDLAPEKLIAVNPKLTLWIKRTDANDVVFKCSLSMQIFAILC